MENKKKYAVFTMDVEDFSDTGCLAMRGLSPEEDMLDGLDEYINILDRHGIKATLFTLKSTAEKIEDKLKDYSDRGHIVALHGYDHTPPKFMDGETFRRRIGEAKEYFEKLLSKKVTGYRAPFFSMNDEKVGILRDLGFRYDSSVHAFTKNYLKKQLIEGEFSLSDYERCGDGVYSKDGFFEFSLSCENILGCTYPVSGGGYVRLCPWPLVKDGIRRYIKKNSMYVFYLHPFELSRKRSAEIKGIPENEKYYLCGGIEKYSEKIETIIEMLKSEGYEFVTFEELCEKKETKVKELCL